MKKQTGSKNNSHFLLVLIAVLLSLSFVTTPLAALAPDMTGEEFEKLTDPTPSEDHIDMETVIGGETAELQADEIVTSTYLEDGVYAFRNIGNGDLWMDLQLDNFSSPAHMQQYYTTTPPTESFSRSMLFKITRVEATNRYIVRLMRNNLLTFDFDGDYVKTKRIPAKDSEVAAVDTFAITRTDSGYTIRPNDSAYIVAANQTTASGSGGAPNSYLIKSTPSAAGACGRWEIHKYTGTSRSGVTTSANPTLTNGLAVGNTSIISVATWSTVIGANTPYLEVTNSFTSRASVSEKTNYISFLKQYDLTGLKVGKFQLAYRIKNASGTNVYTSYQTYFMTPNFDTDLFYIQNGATNMYMDVEGPSTAEGAAIQQWSFSTAPQKQWVVMPAGGGYYCIMSLYSERFVGISASDTSSVRQYGAVNDYATWYFHETDSGRYAIINKALGALNRAIATPSDTSGLGVNLTVATYTNDTSYRDEWLIHSTTLRIVNYYDNSFFNNSAYIQAIEGANEFVSNALKQLFNIDAEMEGIANYWPSANTNQCTRQNFVCDSSCGTVCSSAHHKNLDVILDDIKDYHIRNNEIIIVWMNRPKDVYCTEDKLGQHQIYHGIAVGKIGEPYIETLSLSAYITSTVEYEKIISSILLHEIVHCFGYQDIYGTQGHQNTGDCIMDYYIESAMINHYNNINNKSPFCSNCLTGIVAKINEIAFWR